MRPARCPLAWDREWRDRRAIRLLRRHHPRPLGPQPRNGWLQLVVEFIGGLDDGRSVQIKAVLLAEGSENGPTLLSWVRVWVSRVHREPEVGDDPHAQ